MMENGRFAEAAEAAPESREHGLQLAAADQAEGKVNYQELIQYEEHFHRVVYAATGNKKLEELRNGL